MLSPEEVERRVDVRGGGVPREPIERPVRRVPPPPKERTVARDSLLLIGLVIVGLVAVSFLLPKGPLTGSATNPPGTQAAVASVGATSSGGPTGLTGPTATPFVAVDPSLGASQPATVAPTLVPPTVAPPTPTLKPGQTPHPTPRATPVATPKLTPPPGSPTLTVVVNVVNDDGGLATPSSWLYSFAGANATPSSFPGSSSGTLVTLVAGASYQVSNVAKDAEGEFYTAVQSSHCGSDTGGVLSAGQHATCTITRYDQPVQLKVFTHVNGGLDPASSWAVSVQATGVTPSGTVPGSETGVNFKFSAHASYDVNQSGPSGYDPPSTSGSCSGGGLVPGSHITCTFTFDPTPPPPTDPPPSDPPVLPLLAILPLVLPRRWRPIRQS